MYIPLVPKNFVPSRKISSCSMLLTYIAMLVVCLFVCLLEHSFDPTLNSITRVYCCRSPRALYTVRVLLLRIFRDRKSDFFLCFSSFHRKYISHTLTAVTKMLSFVYFQHCTSLSFKFGQQFIRTRITDFAAHI